MSSRAMTVVTDMWLAPNMPGYEEVRSFYARMAQMGKADTQARAGQLNDAIAAWKLAARQALAAAQVPLDVVVERLQRRDVEQPKPAAGASVELVDPVQERRERLAGAGRGGNEHVALRRDGRPGLRLRCRRRAPRRCS